MKALLLSALLASPAFASDGIPSNGPLTDAEFLRLLTCGAPPDRPCAMDPVKWANPAGLTIAFGPVPNGYAADTARRIAEALDRAITDINSVGSAVHLRRVAPTDGPTITLRPTQFREDDAVTDEPGIADGSRIGAGYVYVNWNANGVLTDATILIAQDIDLSEVDSIVLEEVTQSLGFIHDIENPDYEGVSIFAQDSNTVTSLTGQDAAVLRLHYPD